jgi:lipoprotein-anchoring transpeptidase ErfK/SrfK
MERALKSRRAWTVAALIAFAAIVLPSTAFAADTPATSPATTTPATGADYAETALSDENLLSRWAFVVRKAIAYGGPLKQGRKVRRLTTRTPDGTDELVLVLKQRVYPGQGTWVQVRLPMRGGGRTGWVKSSVLSNYHAVRTRLEINRHRFRATLYKSGRKIWQSRIGVGKKGVSTPAGDFYIRDKLTSTDPRGLYGPYAMGLSAYSNSLSDWPGGGVIGIHGTNQPGLIPGRISHGCIRVPNGKIRRLFKLMPPGTPVKIS